MSFLCAVSPAGCFYVLKLRNLKLLEQDKIPIEEMIEHLFVFKE